MPVDDDREKYKDLEAPWEVGREETVVPQFHRRPTRPVRKLIDLRMILGIVGAVALVVGLVMAFMPSVLQVDADGSAETKVDADQGRAEGLEPVRAPKKIEKTEVLPLQDAGKVVMIDGARVSVAMKIETLLVLKQMDGKARYEINHKKGRAVVVKAAGAEISVVGTVFTVSIEESHILVQVKQGSVQINDKNQRIDLEKGKERRIQRPDAKK